MSYQWIDTPQALMDWLAPVAPGTLLYMDTEFMRERTVWAELALIQVQAGERLALIDAPAIGHAAQLLDFFASYHLVMHTYYESLKGVRYFTPLNLYSL